MLKNELKEIINFMGNENVNVVYLGEKVKDNFFNHGELGVILVKTNGMYNLSLTTNIENIKEIKISNFTEKYKKFKTYIHYNIDFDNEYYYDLEDWNVEGENSFFKIKNDAPNNYRTYDYDVYFKVLGIELDKKLKDKINYPLDRELDRVILENYLFYDYDLESLEEDIGMVVYDLAKITPITKIRLIADKMIDILQKREINS